MIRHQLLAAAVLLSFSGCTSAEKGGVGPPGPTGAQGEKGAPGEPVVVVAVPTNDPNCPTGGSQFSSGGVTTFACNGVAGPPGATGPKGEPGDAGARGPAGFSGLALVSRDTRAEGAASFVSDYGVLPNPGDQRGPFELAAFDFTIAGATSLVTVELLAESASVHCAVSSPGTPSASLVPPITLALTNKSTGVSVGGAGVAIAACVTNTNTAGTRIDCGPVTFRAAISGAVLPPGTYTGVVTFQGRCRNAASSVVLPVTSTISLGGGVLVVQQASQ